MVVQTQSRVQSLVDRYLDARPAICTERARIATESYRKTEAEPPAIRAAMALDAVLRRMSIWILDDELILGHWASTFRGVPVWPELGAHPPQLGFIHAGHNPLAPAIDDKAQQELQELISYWQGRNPTDRACALLPQYVKAAREASLWYWHLGVVRNRGGRYLIDLPTVLGRGFSGIKRDARRRLNQTDPEDVSASDRQSFYRAIIIVCDAVNALARRYAAKASQAADEASGDRKREMEELAAICKRVPANPARNLWEALQSAWFAFMVGSLEAGGDSISPGGLDYVLYPFLKTDIEQGRLTRERAQELVDSFLFKFGENSTPGIDLDSHVNSVTIGRQTEYGQDATNDMTYMLLDALEHVRLPKPQFGLRVNRRTPRELLMRAVDVMRVSGGRPQLNNDDAIIPALLRRGVPIKEARDYSVDGCQHFTTYSRKDHSAWYNLAKTLDLALNNGVDRASGERLGIPRGDPRTFTSFDQVMDAFRDQLEHGVTMLNTESEMVDASLKGDMCLPYASTQVRGCMERGIDVLAGGGRFNWTGMHAVGLATVANSLAAIRKVVFDEGKATMPELMDALDRDFEGHVLLQQMLLHAPKWGNDDDYVDSLGAQVANMWLDECDRHTCHTDPHQFGPTIPGFHSLTFNLNFGEATAATADGRKAGEPLSDGIAPAIGTYKGGPTAVFASAAKVDHARAWTGSLTLTLNEKTEVVATLAKTYLTDMGGTHLMGNLVSPDTLRDARAHPEKYRDLLVRVAGFSARFVELSDSMQDLVIKRAMVGS
ncbi:MAG: pyruvate formate lyase family protein [Chloroflexota bacterium]|nr:pyruvate formate lyase family protein [Chloroflexota bacterium]